MKRLLVAALLGTFMVASASAETLKVDKAKSRIHVDARATGHSFTGTLEDYTITASGDPTTLAPTALTLAWTFTDLKTGDASRDQKMISWLGGGAPKGSFKFLKSWQKDGENYAMGEIAIHGTTKTLSFPYTVKKEGNWITISGTASLDYEDFKLPIIRSALVMTVNPRLTVRFQIVGQL